MDKTNLKPIAFGFLGAASFWAIAGAGPAFAQVQASLPAFVRIQTTTPGTAQTGHSHITGTAIAGQFRGDGSGVFGVNADLLDGLDGTAFASKVHVHGGSDIASGTVPDARLSTNVARRDLANTFNAGPTVFSSGFVGVQRSSQVSSAEIFGIGNSSTGFNGMYVRTAATGKPFYGYSHNGTISGYTYMDGATGEWRLHIGSNDAVSVNSEGNVAIIGSPSTSTALKISEIGDNPVGIDTTSYGGGVNARYGIKSRGSSSSGIQSYGLHAEADGTGVNRAIVGYVAGGSPSDYAFYGIGNLTTTGTKSFEIDHPLDPANKFLRHYCAEGSEPRNIYQGRATTDANGYAWVRLPDYYASINRDPEYNLTVIDSGDDFVLAKVSREVVGNRFQIRTSRPRVVVSWEVKAVRNDLWIQKHGIPVEIQKDVHERGKYVRPELYGFGPEASVISRQTDEKPSSQQSGKTPPR
ncbi:MAG: hypothetical protein JST30_00225 [Armatimonadetes bacterium]|nr:hypothetical protein [Armatimonadota bacterium]